MLIWIASYPRSGNSYLRVLLNALYGIRSGSLYAESRGGGASRSALLDVQLPPAALTDWVHSPEPSLVKTHELPGEDVYPALYLLRDGRDALVSYAHWTLVTRSATARDKRFQAVLRRLIVEGAAEAGSWSQHVMAWTRRPGVVVVRFEQLVADPEGQVERALRALGCSDLVRQPGAVPSFEELHCLEPRIFRRGRIEGWRDEMPRDLQELFVSIHGSAMRQVGYDPGPEPARPSGGIAKRTGWRRAASLLKTRLLELRSPTIDVARQYPPRPLLLPERYLHETLPVRPPRVSVVTPSLNSAEYLARTIRSVVEQDYPDLEYVVQDGESKDGTRELLARLVPPVRWYSQRDSGYAEALNRAFARTTGEIMAWLNADDLLLPGSLRYVTRYFEGHPNVDVVYAHRLLVDREDREVGRWLFPPHDSRLLSWADYVPQETLFWRRRLWERAGSHLDPTFGFAADWELLVRFREAGARFMRLPRFVAAFRVHAGQKTARLLAHEGVENMGRLRERIHGRRVSVAEIDRAVRSYARLTVLYTRLHRLGILRH